MCWGEGVICSWFELCYSPKCTQCHQVRQSPAKSVIRTSEASIHTCMHMHTHTDTHTVLLLNTSRTCMHTCINQSQSFVSSTGDYTICDQYFPYVPLHHRLLAKEWSGSWLQACSTQFTAVQVSAVCSAQLSGYEWMNEWKNFPAGPSAQSCWWGQYFCGIWHHYKLAGGDNKQVVFDTTINLQVGTISRWCLTPL